MPEPDAVPKAVPVCENVAVAVTVALGSPTSVADAVRVVEGLPVTTITGLPLALLSALAVEVDVAATVAEPVDVTGDVLDGVVVVDNVAVPDIDAV